MISENDWSVLLAAAASLPPTGWESIRLKVDAEESLYEFVKQAWHAIEPGQPFIGGWHIEAVCEHLEAVTRGDIRNLIILIPPGCTKTTTACVMWPAWEWISNPATRWLFSSYALPRAQDAAYLCSTLLRSRWYQGNWGDRFRLLGTSDIELYNDHLGWRKCVSVEAGTTGEHGDRLVIDDPHNVKDVESEASRKETVRWHDHAWFNRVNDPMRSARVVIGQTTHYEDLQQHLMRRSDYVVLRIPEQFEIDNRCVTPIGWADPRTEEGELLRPSRFGPEQVAEAIKTLGSLGYATQHQQRPSPAGGNRFKRAWWDGKCRYEVQNGDTFIRQGKPGVVTLNSLAIFIIVDSATSEKETADYTAMLVFGVSPDGDIFILHALRQRLDIEAIIPILDDLCLGWKPDWVGIEANNFQKWVARAARARAQEQFSSIPTVKNLEPRDKNGVNKGKAARAAPAIIRAEAGDIWLPYPDDASMPWVGPLEEELYNFTGRQGGVDDQVDCLSYCVQMVDQLGYDNNVTTDNMPVGYGRRPGPFQYW